MMRIALRHRCGFVSQQALDLVQIDSSLCEPSGKRMPQVMKTKIAQICFLGRESERSREVSSVE